MLDAGKLRIAIISTPKTGNTWLCRLLRSVYDLPQAGLQFPFEMAQARGLGPRWVLFHHVRPEPEILEWIGETKPVLLTCLRHPADVLVSLYYHLRKFQPGEIDLATVKTMLSAPFERHDILSDARGSFQDDLECSLGWLRSGKSIVVRYEDLWRDVHKELTRLTSMISPVPAEKIDLAIERSDFTLMRRLAGDYGRFFRSGNVGGWLGTLPPEVLDELGQDPYRSLIEEFGYSMEPGDPIISAPRVVRPSMNPFRKSGGPTLDETLEEARFDNGVSVAPLLIDFYLAFCRSKQWKGTPDSTCEGSYYQWLNQPCGVIGRDTYSKILITNLAFETHALRTDLHQAFVDLTGPARADYADWFVRGGAAEMEIDSHFIEPMRESLTAWACDRSPEDHEAWPWWPKLPNFAVHRYRRNAGLREAFPDILCFDRWSFLEWIIEHQEETNIDPAFIEPVAKSLKRLAKLRSVGRFLPGARARTAGAR